MDPSVTAADLIALFDRNDVERAIVFPNPNSGDRYPEMNDYIADSAGKYPDRLIGFGRVDPRREDAVKELIRMRKSLELKGLKLHPFVECFRPDHPFFDSFFEKVNQLDLPVLFHTGDGFSSPSLVSRIASKFPQVHLILGHLKEASLNMLERFDNVYVETSGTTSKLIEMAVDIAEDRVLFGSDVPYFPYPTQLAVVEASNIGNKLRRKVFRDNFQKFVLNYCSA
jgi:predicted TIM-barrel fold metal-dependent hydrolase